MRYNCLFMAMNTVLWSSLMTPLQKLYTVVDPEGAMVLSKQWIKGSIVASYVKQSQCRSRMSSSWQHVQISFDVSYFSLDSLVDAALAEFVENHPEQIDPFQWFSSIGVSACADWTSDTCFLQSRKDNYWMPDGAANLGGGRWGYAVTGLRGGPNTAQKFLDFMQFFGKFDKIVCWRPLHKGSASPPTGNSGSALVMYLIISQRQLLGLNVTKQ